MAGQQPASSHRWNFLAEDDVVRRLGILVSRHPPPVGIEFLRCGAARRREPELAMALLRKLGFCLGEKLRSIAAAFAAGPGEEREDRGITPVGHREGNDFSVCSATQAPRSPAAISAITFSGVMPRGHLFDAQMILDDGDTNLSHRRQVCGPGFADHDFTGTV
jgi:hypothetical protein